MHSDKQKNSDEETNDRNRQEPHNPVQAGREAIEAGKINESEKPTRQRQNEEEKDAEAWRNEG